MFLIIYKQNKLFKNKSLFISNKVKIMNVIQYGNENYDSTQAPFLRKSINNDINEHNSENVLNLDNLNLIDNFKLLNLPKNIEDFFINNNSYNCEIYLNNYTFLSMKKIIELHEFYKNDNINNIIDLGFIYEGMGWIQVIYYNTKFNKLFFRIDGGSNNYDRKYNYDLMKKLSYIDSIDLIENKNYNFDELLEKINNNVI